MNKAFCWPVINFYRSQVTKNKIITLFLYLKFSAEEPVMRGSRKFCRKRSNFDNVSFLVDEGREKPNTTLSGPSSARRRNAIKMAFRWRADDVPTLNAGLVTL